MKRGNLRDVGLSVESDRLAKRQTPKKRDSAASAKAIDAARQFLGDDEASVPISSEEEAIMAEVRAEHGRPSKREIKELAKRLARRV